MARGKREPVETVIIDGHEYPTRVLTSDAGRKAPLIELTDQGVRMAEDTDTPPTGTTPAK